MATDPGRPRDPRIDGAVLTATCELLAEVGYADLSVAAIAERAGTTKPAIYRRWPSKTHLVHEAAFPATPVASTPSGALADDVRAMVADCRNVFSDPVARAALPGLVAEVAADPELHAALLTRFAGVFAGLRDRLSRAVADGEARPVDVDTFVEVLGGTTLFALLVRPALDEGWVDRTTDLLLKGLTAVTTDSTAAWGELLATLGRLDQTFLEGPRAVTDDRHLADGYRMLATTLGVALDTYLFAEPSRPVFTEVNSPSRRDRRWGGDNTDAYYFVAPIDPTRRYRVTGQRGDSVYFSLTVYNEPAPGTWSDKIVRVVRDTDLDFDADGNFEVILEPDPDAAVVMTRDYQLDPLTGRPVTWRIEALDEPDPIQHGDAETAAALRASAKWLETMFAIIPLAVGVRSEDAHTLGHEIGQVANEFGDAYQVPDANFGWSARDACYSFGSFVLEDDEALVVTHRPPECRFWNLVVWNQFMATHNAADARSSVNGGSAVPNSDGSVTVVISRGMTEHPNSLTTVDYPRGNLAFRWFLADHAPARPEARVVKLADAPTQPT